MAKLQLGAIATRSGETIDTRYTLPKGDPGAKGDTGNSATITIGTITTGAAGSAASVINSGSSTAAVLDFSIPQGIQGATPVITGTSTSSVGVGSGANKTFVTQPDLPFIVPGAYVRVALTGTPSTYMGGPVVSYSGTTMVINAQESSGTGTLSGWTISIAGPRGITGTNGTTPVITSTSTTSQAIAIASKTFTTAAAMTAAVGTPIRVINTGTPANYMFGLVTAISGTSITINVTEIGGSGTFTAWTLSYSGLTGTVADSSITSAKIVDGTIVDADISSAAAITASKLTGVPVIVKAVSGSYPARPTTDIVIWKGSVDPGTLAVNGDYWDDVD